MNNQENDLNLQNKRTCLYNRHVALGAKIVPFAGYDMPLQYTDIISEHNAVRNGCGVFDVSHMGEVVVSGKDAENFVQYIFTNDISNAPVGKIYYGMMLYDDGGVVDDLLVYKMAGNEFFLVINAANIDKDIAWLEENSKAFDVMVSNRSDAYAQLAVQGPDAESVMNEVLGIDTNGLTFYTFKTCLVCNAEVIVSRTGYTGEDGFEIYSDGENIVKMWDKLIDSKKAVPCGLGARDTLRFESGLPLYGQELGDDISPIEAGLGIFVKLAKPRFIGKDVMEQQKNGGVSRRLVGLELVDHAIPRHGYCVESNGTIVGHVTTGYKSITSGKSVAMALVDTPFSKKGTSLEVMIHNRLHTATVVDKKFYNKKYKR